MKICIIGTGYVGLVTGTCLAELGFEITCVDLDHEKIERLKRGEIPIYEPGLEDLVKKGIKSGRLKFSTDIRPAVSAAEIVFIAVGTPPSEKDSQADLSYVFSAAKTIAESMEGYTVVVTKSTVPVDTAKKLEKYIREINPTGEFDVVSNPEFLREGSALEDFMNPDRIVVGCRSARAEAVMRRLYNPFFLLQTSLIFTSPESSEIIKYAANSFLATKVTFINQVADLCERCDADITDVARGVGLDSRIGRKFLQAGPGYGGSCFPKDTIAMAKTAEEYGCSLTIVESVIQANETRKIAMVHKIKKACSGSVDGKKIAVLGVTFKPDTDDMRDSPSLTIIPPLQEMGAIITAYDPAGMENAKAFLPKVKWAKDVYEALKGADALVILTEWNEFRYLDFSKAKKFMETPLIVDLRNLYRLEDMKSSGFSYHSVGRPVILPS
jgi:UDPglucose 6-dehydrogenase